MCIRDSVSSDVAAGFRVVDREGRAVGAPYAWAAVPILTSKAAVGCCLGIMEEDGAALNPYVGRTAKLQLQFGLLLALFTAIDPGARGRFFFG